MSKSADAVVGLGYPLSKDEVVRFVAMGAMRVLFGAPPISKDATPEEYHRWYAETDFFDPGLIIRDGGNDGYNDEVEWFVFVNAATVRGSWDGATVVPEWTAEQLGAGRGTLAKFCELAGIPWDKSRARIYLIVNYG